jgi:hypothetical protein
MIVDCDEYPLDSAAMFGINSPIEVAYCDAISFLVLVIYLLWRTDKLGEALADY